MQNISFPKLTLWLRVFALSTSLAGNATNAQVVLYDNTGVADQNGPAGPANGPVFGGPGPVGSAAQQFFTGDFDNVSAVTLSLGRVGSPSGQLNIEIWDDNGSGLPGTLVGTVGSVDLGSLPTTPEFITFNDPVVDLVPKSAYYVVLPPHPIENFENTYSWGVRTSSEGTNGADLALLTPCDTPDWCKAGPFLGPPPPGTGAPADALANYLQMRVTAVPEPSGIALIVLGLAATGVLRLRQTRKA